LDIALDVVDVDSLPQEEDFEGEEWFISANCCIHFFTDNTTTIRRFAKCRSPVLNS
jgi:hypothetical protein